MKYGINEVTVFSLGDSRKISTWSNVPYFFTQTLLAKNIKVNRVDLGLGLCGRVVNKTLRQVAGFVSKGSSDYDYSRTLLHYRAVKRRIRHAVQAYPDADANIFLTFSFSSAGLSRQPAVLFGDWTYDHWVRHFRSREPNRFERASIARENREIESADAVFVLFPGVARQMQERYANRNIFYAGNVVNSLVDVGSPEEVLPVKLSSQMLLFIGNRKYQDGARQLLRAYSMLKPRYPGLSVNVIGMQRGDLGPLPDGFTCHGYLDKGKARERELYYGLLRAARAIVNTTPKWGAFSAMLEAMHFYNPVVVTPYDEFVKTFGHQIDFGSYCGDETVETLCARIEALLGDESYSARCISAHQAVAEFNWSNYVDTLLARIADRPGMSSAAPQTRETARDMPTARWQAE
jgi:glycosyltransferase involved in cell wall biosynthesis